MTPKQKAIELVEKLNDHIESVSDYRYELAFAKKRTLICVDEIIEIQYGWCNVEGEQYKYWQEVKEEIKKL